MSRKEPPASRISQAMIDEMLQEQDPKELFQSGDLLRELQQRLAERILGAELDVHLERETERDRGNTRNGVNPKTVLTDTESMPLGVPRDPLRSVGRHEK